jgi:hypothetical protein
MTIRIGRENRTLKTMIRMSGRLQSKHLESREIAPWTEGEQTWRRLAVTFTKTVANHNADQVFYCDDAFMQRRMDYSPDVTRKPPVAHHTHEHKPFDGCRISDKTARAASRRQKRRNPGFRTNYDRLGCRHGRSNIIAGTQFERRRKTWIQV